MTLIICEKYRIARAVARSLKATTRLHFGVFTNKEITVAFVRKNFITLTPLSGWPKAECLSSPPSIKCR